MNKQCCEICIKCLHTDCTACRCGEFRYKFPKPETVGDMSWETEFDINFAFDGVNYKGQRHWKDGVKENLVKAFIKRHIAQARLEEKEKVRSWIRENKMKSKYVEGYPDFVQDDYPDRQIFNSALEQLEKFLEQ